MANRICECGDDGYAPAKDEDMRLHYETVGPGYFQTMRFRLCMAGISMSEIRGRPGVGSSTRRWRDATGPEVMPLEAP